MALRVWLPLNDGTINNKGINNAIITPSSITYNTTTGKIGNNCLNGGTLQIKVPTIEDSKICTFAFWAYVNSSLITNNWTRVARFNDKGTNAGSNMRFEICPSSYQNGIYCFSNHNNTNYGLTTGCITSPTGGYYNQWVHFCFTSDGTTFTRYMNGVQIGTCVYNGEAVFSGDFFLENNDKCFKQDLRIYDECLSPKQVKEISKGLVAHYKLDNPYIETTSNLAPGINGTTSYSTNTSPAWDTELNGTPMINPSGWGNGYNGGVTDPTHGYHAHWVRENGQWLMMFPNLNSVINQKGRWEGISSGVSTKDILAGEKYTISWWQKTDNLNLAAWGGIYYKKTSDGTMNFWDSCPTLGYNTKLNTWQFMYKTFTRSSEYVQHDGGQSVYVYGGNSNEGTMYVKDVQIVRGDHPLPYAVGTRNGQTYEFDCSGNGYNGKVIGTVSYNPETPRYDGCTKFNGSTGCIAVGRPMPKDALTVNVWASMDNWTSYNGRIGSCTEGGGWNFEPMSGAMNFALGVGASSCTYMTNYTSSQTPLSGLTAGWHMFTGTFDGIYKRIYIDGVLKGETNGLQNGTALTTATPIFYNGNNGVFIGAEAGSSATAPVGNYFNGSISDFRIYAIALSADDVLTMYKNSGIIDNKGNVYAYEFKEE